MADTRRARTRAAIFTAFEELIADKRYEEITIQEIIERAHIGRTTFYTHFLSKDDMLKELIAEMFTHIFDDPLEEEETHDLSDAERTESTLLIHILYHLEEDERRYTPLFTGRGAQIFWNQFQIQLRRKLAEQKAEGTWQPRPGIPDDLYMDLYVTCYIDAVIWWFRHGCEESPQNVIGYFESFCGMGK